MLPSLPSPRSRAHEGRGTPGAQSRDRTRLPGPRAIAALCIFLFASPVQGATTLDADHPSGFYETPFDLTLSAPTPRGGILYTTNGAAPTPEHGIPYTGPLRITTTSVLRAVATGLTPQTSEELCRTFLFLKDVPDQTGTQFPTNWASDGGPAVPASYRMAPATQGEGRGQVSAALASLPTLALVADPGDLFSPATGIYTHPVERGSTWERRVHAEWFGAGDMRFQITCGLRIHGGTSRQSDESPKHSFRLVFRRRYGAANLRASIFGPEAQQTFDSLVLRAGNNDSWLASDGQARHHADYLRDEWGRRSLLAMGYPSARGRFVHLYLNGVYWGAYDLCERPDASFFSAVTSHPESEFDVRKGDKTESGDAVAWNRVIGLANAGVNDAHAYAEIGRQVDLEQLADFLILNFYAGNNDWDRSANWYAYRPRTPAGRFRFLVWDAESVLREPDASTVDFDDEDSPPRLFQRLSQNAEFRALFAERARRLLCNDGPLAPAVAATRYQALVDLVGPAIPAEAARWGTYRKTVHRFRTGPFDAYTSAGHWRPEVARVLTQFFPRRGEILLGQFAERGLYSTPRSGNGPSPP